MLRDKLDNRPAELRQAYARLLMDEVRVTGEEIRISGSKGRSRAVRLLIGRAR
jgi:hypothetical protein